MERTSTEITVISKAESDIGKFDVELCKSMIKRMNDSKQDTLCSYAALRKVHKNNERSK